jgi:hypothetical protein
MTKTITIPAQTTGPAFVRRWLRISLIMGSDFAPWWALFHAIVGSLEANRRRVLIQVFCPASSDRLPVSLRMLSPVKARRWALWTRRSRMASARVGSPMTSCH